MTSRPTCVFLDANVLAKPVTRTLLIVGGPASHFRVVWSAYAEAEADRNLAPGKTPVADLRTRFGWELGPAGAIDDRFPATSATDRQILADAAAAGACFLVTEDVDDFGEMDLAAVSMAAVNPDLFMAARLSPAGYLEALDRMTANRQIPPKTREELHATVARGHPQLFAAHADLFQVEPMRSVHNPPRTQFRGVRCLRCGRALSSPARLTGGFGPRCKALA